MAKKKYHVRKFLNKTKGIACIEVNAGYTAWNFDCNVTLADCNRRIDLDFTMWKAKDVKEKLAKLDLLIGELCALKLYLGDATEDFIKLNNATKKDDTLVSVLDEEDD